MNEVPLLPGPDDPIEEVLGFAAAYDAYERWAGTPERLEQLLEPIRQAWDTTGRIPLDIGNDALRALLFYEFRADHFAGGSEYGEQRMRQVVEALRRLDNAAAPEG